MNRKPLDGGCGHRCGCVAAASVSSRPARPLFVLGLLLIPASQLLVYPILRILMPQAGEAPPAATSVGDGESSLAVSGALDLVEERDGEVFRGDLRSGR